MGEARSTSASSERYWLVQLKKQEYSVEALVCSAEIKDARNQRQESAEPERRVSATGSTEVRDQSTNVQIRSRSARTGSTASVVRDVDMKRKEALVRSCAARSIQKQIMCTIPVFQLLGLLMNQPQSAKEGSKNWNSLNLFIEMGNHRNTKQNK